TFDNLAPLATYLGKPGDPSKGGVPFAEYMRRQELHAASEKAAMLDTVHFIERANRLYGYDNFICDTSGSIVEVVDPDNPHDPVLSAVCAHLLPIWIEGTDDHAQELIRRFKADPKPMYYQAEFLRAAWDEYRLESGEAEETVDPDAFVTWTFARALAHRRPRYAAIAKNWGLTVQADEIGRVRNAADFEDLVSSALEMRG
ncbi:MAG: ATPase, partial [Rhodobacteraceae bacterium]|nr:ATPase [Paracoccaceae bacterium]